ncbi:WGR domain-containing protein [Brucella cytisi]|uniref:WGR domain-containing protein n=1 Tax=Brucella cytisi TaxID=407152 RepID=UPI0035DA6ED6
MFGEPCLTRQWGRIGTTGQIMLQHFEHETDAVQMFLTLARKKKMWGYRSRRFSQIAQSNLSRSANRAMRSIRS